MSPTSSIIVTGGNAGLGFEAARHLARDRSRLVVIAARNPAFAEEAVAKLAAAGGHAAFLPLDLISQASVRRFAEEFRAAALPPLRGIVCNAGMQNVATPARSPEGYEATFAVNHLGHYLLVRLLLDDLAAGGRITMVASGTHDPKERTGLPEPVYETANAVADDVETATRMAGLRRYTTSKLCNVFFTYELARRLAGSNDARMQSLKVNAIDPGLMPATGLARSWPAPLRWVARNVLPFARLISDNVHSPETSGRRVAELTTGPDAEPGGRYFRNGSAVKSSELSYDETRARDLWEASARMTGLPERLNGLSTTDQPNTNAAPVPR